MRVAKEERMTTLAIPCIYRRKKNYPREDAAHVALRTIRRFLEHYAIDFDLVILCMDDAADLRLYEKWMPVYFPRSASEEAASAAKLANMTLGDSFGEPVIEERKIRISSHFDNQDDDEGTLSSYHNFSSHDTE